MKPVSCWDASVGDSKRINRVVRDAAVFPAGLRAVMS